MEMERFQRELIAIDAWDYSQFKNRYDAIIGIFKERLSDLDNNTFLNQRDLISMVDCISNCYISAHNGDFKKASTEDLVNALIKEIDNLEEKPFIRMCKLVLVKYGYRVNYKEGVFYIFNGISQYSFDYNNPVLECKDV